jgi:hypothetical protein
MMKTMAYPSRRSKAPAAAAAAAPVAAPEGDAAASAEAVELLERRRFVRPIPTAQVIECGEEESWELWSQWSSL